MAQAKHIDNGVLRLTIAGFFWIDARDDDKSTRTNFGIGCHIIRKDFFSQLNIIVLTKVVMMSIFFLLNMILSLKNDILLLYFCPLNKIYIYIYILMCRHTRDIYL